MPIIIYIATVAKMMPTMPRFAYFKHSSLRSITRPTKFLWYILIVAFIVVLMTRYYWTVPRTLSKDRTLNYTKSLRFEIKTEAILDGTTMESDVGETKTERTPMGTTLSSSNLTRNSYKDFLQSFKQFPNETKAEARLRIKKEWQQRQVILKGSVSSPKVEVSAAPTKVFIYDTIVNPHFFKFIINGSDICPKDKVTLIVTVVHTAPGNYKRRMVIR